MSKRSFWLMKSEPDVFGIQDLSKAKNKTSMWEGVRNYEARNFMRDKMKLGDGVLFYHSNANPPGIVGTAFVSSEPYPDPTQFDPNSDYFDPKSSKENIRWQLINITYLQTFPRLIERAELIADPILADMMIFKRNRLSITPVTEQEWILIHELVNAKILSYDI